MTSNTNSSQEQSSAEGVAQARHGEGPSGSISRFVAVVVVLAAVGVAYWFVNRDTNAPSSTTSKVRVETLPAIVTTAQASVPTAAVLAAEEAARLAPTPESYLNLSLAYYQARRFPESIVAAQQALKLRPAYAEAWNNIGAAYNELGLWDEAIKACEEAVRLKPDLQIAKNNLAWALSQKASKK